MRYTPLSKLVEIGFVSRLRAERALSDDRLVFNLTLKNLFDKQYLDHASNEDFENIPGYEGIRGSYEPGRELRLGVALRI